MDLSGCIRAQKHYLQETLLLLGDDEVHLALLA